MRLALVALFAVLGGSVVTEAVLAQGHAPNSIAPTATELRTAAQLRLPVPLISDHLRLATDMHYSRAGRREGETLMIVGGAVLLTGLLVDESLITIAGAAVGGYGLYLYLRAPPKRRKTP